MFGGLGKICWKGLKIKYYRLWMEGRKEGRKEGRDGWMEREGRDGGWRDGDKSSKLKDESNE